MGRLGLGVSADGNSVYDAGLDRRPDAGPCSEPKRGFTMIELTVALAIAAIIVLFVAPYLFRIYRRETLKSAVREVGAIVLATRWEAVKRNQNVVLLVNLSPRNLTSWVDNPPYNFTQDAGERVVSQYTLPAVLSFVLPGGSTGATVVSFDKYNGDDALVDRIVFQGDGTLVEPQAGSSKRPIQPGAYTASVPSGTANCPDLQCRGLHMADRVSSGEIDLFRVSVDDFGSSGKVTVLKWLPEALGGNPGEVDYVPPPWKWVN